METQDDIETIEFKVDVPTYVRAYQEDRSILHISTEEYDLLNSSEHSFPKTMLISRLTYVLKYDIHNYLVAVSRETSSERRSLPIAELSSEDCEILSTVTLSYRDMGPRMIDDHRVRRRISAFLEKAHYIIDNWILCLGESIYFDPAFYDYICVNENETVQEKILSQLKITYRILTTLRDSIFYLDERYRAHIDELLIIYKPFFNISAEEICLENYSYTTELLKSLYLIKERDRSKLYHIVILLQSLRKSTPPVIRGFALALEVSIEEVEYEPQPFDIFLSQYNAQSLKRITFNPEHIAYLRMVDKNCEELIGSIIPLLHEIRAKYYNGYAHIWENNTIEDAAWYYNRNKSKTNWNDYYIELVCKMRAYVGFKTPECYYSLVANDVQYSTAPLEDLLIHHGSHTKEEEPAKFSFDLVMNLIDLLRQSGSKDQTGLYKAMYQINYSWKRRLNGTASDNRYIVAAMNYINCLFDERNNCLSAENVGQVKDAIAEILSLDDIQDTLMDIPRGFTCGFNFQLVYRIIGMVLDKGYFKVKPNKLNNILSTSNGQMQETNGNKPIDRSHYFNKKISEQEEIIINKKLSTLLK